MLTNAAADRSWWAHYAYFWTHWENPDNYVEWWTPGHPWFILFVYALLAVWLFVWMRRGRGRRVIGWFAAACRIPSMVIVVPAVFLLAQQALAPMDDISGQSPAGFFLLFLIGFVMVADERVTAMAARAALWPGSEDYPDPSWQDSVVNWLGYQDGLWMVIVGLIGLFHRYADRRGGPYAYATEAAYPLCILHQTVIVLIAYVVVQWGVGIPLKFTLIAATSFALTVAVYEVAIKRWGVARPLFGTKPKRRTT